MCRANERKLVETKAANMLRGGEDGAVVLYKLWSAIPWVLDNLETVLGVDCPGVRQQLMAVHGDPTKLFSAREMDPLTLINSVNRTQSAVEWERSCGAGEDISAEIIAGRRRVDRNGKKIEGVLELRKGKGNERKVNKRNAEHAIRSAERHVPAAPQHSPVTRGEGCQEE